MDRLIFEKPDEGVTGQLARGQFPESLRHLGVAFDPRGVIKKAAQRNRAALGVEVDVLREVCIEIEFVFLDQKHDRRGGELLRDRANFETRVGRRRNHPFEVDVAVASLEQRHAILYDRHGYSGDHLVLDPGARHRVQRRYKGAPIRLSGRNSGNDPEQTGRGERAEKDSQACLVDHGDPYLTRTE